MNVIPILPGGNAVDQFESPDRAREVMGGKGFGLARMASHGINVPPAFVIPAQACTQYLKNKTGAGLWATRVLKAMEDTGHLMTHRLWSVRSGARVSMPGMMDTILNVGITRDNLVEMQKWHGERLALDCYRRFLASYGEIVDGIDRAVFAKQDSANPNIAELKSIVGKFETIRKNELPPGEDFLGTLHRMLTKCIEAVFESWNSERAREYRKLHGIPDAWGTAVTVQRMVFGNRDKESCTGVVFSRCPKTGNPGLTGEFLINGQGEEVVSGIRTPSPIHHLNTKIYSELSKVASSLEKLDGDMQEIEFTVDAGELFVLQTRSGKRSAESAFRIAYDMAGEGALTQKEALSRIDPNSYSVLSRPRVDEEKAPAPLATGIGASAGVVTGVAELTSQQAQASGEPCILVTEETLPEDFPGMVAAVGILTLTGGETSHAAVVARGMNKPAVVGAATGGLAKTHIAAGDKVTIDGATGRVWVNETVAIVPGGVPAHAIEMLSEWGDHGYTVRYAPTSPTELPDTGSIIVDPRHLMEAATTEAKKAKALRGLLTAMRAKPGLRGVLDLSTPEPDMFDRQLRIMMGLTGIDGKAVVYPLPAKVADVFKSAWSAKFKSRWSVQTDADGDLLEEHGWNPVLRCDSVGALIEQTDAAVILTKKFDDQVAKVNTTTEAIVSLLRESGRNVTVLGEDVEEGTLPYLVFGEGA